MCTYIHIPTPMKLLVFVWMSDREWQRKRENVSLCFMLRTRLWKTVAIERRIVTQLIWQCVSMFQMKRKKQHENSFRQLSVTRIQCYTISRLTRSVSLAHIYLYPRSKFPFFSFKFQGKNTAIFRTQLNPWKSTKNRSFSMIEPSPLSIAN